ncbi:MAG TPA: hypothetical protein VHA75_11400 [Rugosimonospora sp.]|nr:hypothetical protein [Rugosimonospora sp.]
MSTDVLPGDNFKILWVDAGGIADITAPTVAELEAGLELSYRVTRDGVEGWEAQTGNIDTTPVSSDQDTGNAGRITRSGPALTFKKKTTSDTAYTTMVYLEEGFIVMRRYIDTSTAWTAGQGCEVYPVQCGETILLPKDDSRAERFKVPYTITSRAELRAVVAA